MGFLFSPGYVAFSNIIFVVFSCVLLIFSANSENHFLVRNDSGLKLYNATGHNDCSALKHLDEYDSKCLYLKSHGPCVNQGFIDYLSLLYCNFDGFPVLGQILLFLWLLVLFYLLGDTASEYFCSSLESLSKLLDLSPTIAGVTLLSLGNGAPDVFASLASFTGESKDTYDVGLNTVVGGASFVSCVVIGIISVSLHKKHIQIEKSAFLRDFCFFAVVIGSLVLILVRGEINLWCALVFCSIYAVYVAVVWASWKLGAERAEFDPDSVHENDLEVPILEKYGLACVEEGAFGNDCRVDRSTDKLRYFRLLIWAIQLPLYLPRRLTIPVVSESKWSKPVAVASATLAPIFLSFLWNSRFDRMTFEAILVYSTGCFLGVILGFLASTATEKSSPPKNWLLPWLVGGFAMSMTWSYISAQELVALLTSLGYIFGLSPSILGLTVLAWGNSISDLITNVTMALHDGREGAQVAVSGCYAGPIFNTLFGLGLSLVGSAWEVFPNAVAIKTDPCILESLAFLAAGLIWALVVLLRNGMKLDGVLGTGLLVIYLASLSLRLIQTVGESLEL